MRTQFAIIASVVVANFFARAVAALVSPPVTSWEMQEREMTVSQYIEMVIREHRNGGITMANSKTLAFQVSEVFFRRIKDYLARYEQVYHRKLTQREFVLGLIEQALEEAEEEFEAALCAQEAPSPDEGEPAPEEPQEAPAGGV